MASRAQMILGYNFYSLRENHQLAKEIFLTALKIQPENPQVLSAWVLICYKLNESKKCQKYLEESLKVDKDNTPPLIHWGISMRDRGQVRQAVQECEKALKLKPGYPALSGQPGWAYFKSGNLPKAKKFLSEALEKILRTGRQGAFQGRDPQRDDLEETDKMD